jgi:hypothetical protein
MDIYQQVMDFTAAGAARFADFIKQHGREGLDRRWMELACLGTIEDNLNSAPVGTVLPFSGRWELPALDSRDGTPHVYEAELDEVIISPVTDLDLEFEAGLAVIDADSD